MRLLAQRYPTRPGFMHSDLSVDGVPCIVLIEDELREHKIPGETAIGAGIFVLQRYWSPTFSPKLKLAAFPEGRHVLRLIDVPNFTDILMHPGNTDKATRGCLVTGSSRNSLDENWVNRSVIAFHKLMDIVEPYLITGKRADIEIRNAPGDKYVDTGNLAVA